MATDTLEAPPNVVPATPPRPLTPPTVEISASSLGKPSGPTTPPKPGSAKESAWKALRKAAHMEEESTAATQKSPAAESPEAASSPPNEAASSESEPSASETEASESATKPADPAAATPDKKKVSPWKLVDDYKARLTKAEARAAELEKSVVPEKDRTAAQERLAKAEARAKELEDRVKFYDYSQSEEFQKEYQKPYEDAWKRRMLELSEIPVTDPNTQQSRALSNEDMITLVTMNLVEAKATAEKVFGDFAPDVMAARAELRGLMLKKNTALAEAKKNNAENYQKQIEAKQAQLNEITTHVQKTWEKVNTEIMADPALGKYFKPIEGNKDWNGRLEKGFKMVDQALAKNARDPSLTPEQRSELVKLHAAIRNRAASWGAVRWQLEQVQAERDALKKDLEKFKSSTPTASGTAPSGPSIAHISARERAFGALRQLAK